MKKIISLLLAVVLLLTGCGSDEETAVNKVRDLDYTIVESDQVPEELQKAIDEKKKTTFKLTYGDQENLYIAIGYGEQKTGGYSISVNDLYLADNAIYFDTDLIGPKQDEVVEEAASYPYIVIKIEYMDENVVFQ